MRGVLLFVLAMATGWALAPLAAVAQAPSDSASSSESARGDMQAPLHPGDRIRLKIWREPDLSGDYDVDESGQAVFPKVGPLQVTGMSSTTLKRTLVDAYARYLRNPAIEVRLLRRVNILGAVRTPGLYQVDPTMTLADAAALAGGASSDGSPDKVDLVRQGEKLPIKLSRRTRLAETPLQSGDQLYFRQRSWMSRNTGVIAGILTATAGIIVTVATRN
jgi:protein involved in polysaccharide export with SLBB domain